MKLTIEQKANKQLHKQEMKAIRKMLRSYKQKKSQGNNEGILQQVLKPNVRKESSKYFV
jgi:hypothetical protein